MSDNLGWVKIHRQIMYNSLWTSEVFTRGQAWIDMILLANHADGMIRIRGHKFDVLRGQLGWSMVNLAARWKWSRQKVKSFFDELQDAQQIVQQNNNITSIITIVNYEDYQSEGTAEGTANFTAKKQRKSTNKNVKNEKKETLIALADKILEAYKKIKPPGKDTSRGRAKKHLTKLLKDFSEADLIAAVENYGKVTQSTEIDFRRSAGNFFGRDEDFRQYLPGEFDDSGITSNPDDDYVLSKDQIEFWENYEREKLERENNDKP